MELLRHLLLATHLLGMAAIIGGWLAMRSGGGVLPAFVWGARAQIITGVLLVGVIEMGDLDPLNRVKIGIKLVIALVVTGMAESAAAVQRDGKPGVTQRVHGAAGLAVVNVLLATLWT